MRVLQISNNTYSKSKFCNIKFLGHILSFLIVTDHCGCNNSWNTRWPVHSCESPSDVYSFGPPISPDTTNTPSTPPYGRVYILRSPAEERF